MTARTFKVWDEKSATEQCSEEIFEDSAWDAALVYVLGDSDGLHEGIYSGSGRNIMVREPNGWLWRFAIAVDWEPNAYVVRDEVVDETSVAVTGEQGPSEHSSATSAGPAMEPGKSAQAEEHVGCGDGVSVVGVESVVCHPVSPVTAAVLGMSSRIPTDAEREWCVALADEMERDATDLRALPTPDRLRAARSVVDWARELRRRANREETRRYDVGETSAAATGESREPGT